MKTLIFNLCNFMLKNIGDFKKIPLRIVKKNDYVDAKIQRVFLDHYVSMIKEKSVRNVSTIIRPSTLNDPKK